MTWNVDHELPVSRMPTLPVSAPTVLTIAGDVGHESRSIQYRAAVRVLCPVIGAPLHRLAQAISLRSMDYRAMEPCGAYDDVLHRGRE